MQYFTYVQYVFLMEATIMCLLSSIVAYNKESRCHHIVHSLSWGLDLFNPKVLTAGVNARGKVARGAPSMSDLLFADDG